MADRRAVTGKYVGADASWLSSYQTSLRNTLTKILDAHQSYSRPGFTFNRAEFNDVSNELAEVDYALRQAGTKDKSRTYADMRSGS